MITTGQNPVNESPPLQVKVFTSLAELKPIRHAWEAMQRHPNSDFNFYSLIVSLRPEVVRPYVLVVTKGDEPQAVVAGRVEDDRLEIKVGYKVIFRPKVRRLTILYGGCMGQADDQVNELIVRRLLQSLREEGADLLSWSGLRWQSDLHQLLGCRPRLLCRDFLARPHEHWTMALPRSLDEFLAVRMNKKHRYWAKRTMRILEKDFPGSVRFACLSKPDEMDKLFADTANVARKTYQSGLGVGFQDGEENRQRLRLGAERGWLRGFVLYLNEEPKAFWLCTVYKDVVHLDFTGYDPQFRKYELGTALFLRMIGELGAQGLKQLDFGLGTAFYKERFGDGKFKETAVCVFRPTLRGISLNALRLVTQGPAQLTRSLLLRLRLEQQLKRLWRTYVTPSGQTTEPAEARP